MNEFINRHKKTITIIIGLLIPFGLLYGAAGFDDMKDILLILATIAGGIPIALKAFQSLRMRAFSIELLITIAIIGALYLREYIESSIVVFLFLFGGYLEARTLEKARSSLKNLVDMAPQEATVIRDKEEVSISVTEVIKGEKIIVRSGGKIPVDGSITSGRALLNEAAVTGESIPTSKTIGDKIFSGTMVDNGYIEIVAERIGGDSTFAKIIELIEEAQETKSRTERFLDKFANIYTPAVVILSVIVYIITHDIHLSITFLVVACPGALIIGAPVSNVVGIGNGAKNGVLIKGAEVMEKLSKVNTVIFDKTGTLTKGKPEITDIKTFDGRDPDEVLRMAAEAEAISEHHLGQTIIKEAKVRKLSLGGKPITGKIIKGSGILVKMENYGLAIGNRKLMVAEHIDITNEMADYATQRQKMGNTAIWIAVDGRIAGVISIADQIRDDAQEALVEMRKNGIKKVVMLTGDNTHTAAMVAGELRLDEFYAELLPEDKVGFIKKLKAERHIVAMVGDGINDAPAIATADIGIAMGEGGTDVSMETADVVLMADKLMQFSHAYSLAKATIRNIKQNTFFAIATVCVLLAGVLTENVHLASGMFIHETSVLLVILNAMRLVSFKNEV